MAGFGEGTLFDIYQGFRTEKERLVGMPTVGFVVAVNDPQEMGRVRVACPALGDPNPYVSSSVDFENFPWASPLNAFAGSTAARKRGPEEHETDGFVAYGSHNPPPPNSMLLIACVDGDSQYRIYLGGLNAQFQNHTLPHGRFIVRDGILDGPLSSTEQPIQPLYDNLTEMFGTRDNHEWISRGADYSASAVPPTVLKDLVSELPDDKQVDFTLPDGTTITFTQGYSENRVNGESKENSVYSQTTPGFHSWSMDDRIENCRVRIRSSTGHQILLDDTNERLFIGTNKGKSWAELDSKGNFDLFSARRLSIHGAEDLNLVSNQRVRLYGKAGVHITSDADIRMESGADTHIKNTNLILKSTGVSANANDYDIKAGNTFNVSSGAINHEASKTLMQSGKKGVHLKSEDVFVMSASSDMTMLTNSGLLYLTNAGTHINSGGGPTNITGSAINLNGAPATTAPGPAQAPSPASPDTIKYAYTPSRVPFDFSTDDLPWSRTSIDPSKSDNDSSSNLNLDFYSYSNLEFSYTDSNSNKVDLGDDLKRNSKWRR